MLKPLYIVIGINKSTKKLHKKAKRIFRNFQAKEMELVTYFRKSNDAKGNGIFRQKLFVLICWIMKKLDAL